MVPGISGLCLVSKTGFLQREIGCLHCDQRGFIRPEVHNLSRSNIEYSSQ